MGRSLISGSFLVVALSVSPRLGHSGGTKESSPAKRSPKEIIKSWFKTCRLKDEFKARACEQRKDQDRVTLTTPFTVTGEFACLGRYDFDAESFPLEIRHPIGYASAKLPITRSGKGHDDAPRIDISDGAYLTIAPIASEDRERRKMETRGYTLKLRDIQVARATAEEFKRKNRRLLVELIGAVGSEWSYDRGATILEAAFGVVQRTVFGIRLRVDRIRVWNPKTKATFVNGAPPIEWNAR